MPPQGPCSRGGSFRRQKGGILCGRRNSPFKDPFREDTVFPGSCGRLDLPGSDARVMYDSLRRLAALPESLVIFPGHGYNGASSTIGAEKRTGLLRPMTREQWDRSMVR